MKVTSKQFISFAHNVLKRKKRQSVRLINPKRDWMVGLGIALLLLLAVVAWSGYMYVSNRFVDETGVNDESVSVPMYRAAAVSEALDYFSNREATFEELLSVAVPVVQVEVVEEATPADADPSTESASSTQPTNDDDLEEPDTIEPEENASSSPDTVGIPQAGLSL